MRCAIIGHGKMGREIERILLERGHSVELVIDEANSHELTAENLQGVDVAFEFTTPDTALHNVRTVLEAGGRVVCGTTGWLDSKIWRRWPWSVAEPSSTPRTSRSVSI